MDLFDSHCIIWWKIIDSIGFDEKNENEFWWRKQFSKINEPVFVLQPEEESYNKDIDTTAAGTRLWRMNYRVYTP